MCQSNKTALLREVASFVPGYQCNSPVAPVDFDRLISEYRLISGYRLVAGPILYSYIIHGGVNLMLPALIGLSNTSDIVE